MGYIEPDERRPGRVCAGMGVTGMLIFAGCCS